MAKFLIKAEDGFHSRLNSPAEVSHEIMKDRQGCYKSGDIAVIMPDGHEWGGREGLPRFVRVNCPGLQPKDVKHLLEPERDIMNPEEVSRCKLWQVMLDRLPPEIQKELAATGEVTMPYAQFRLYVRNKATGETA